jgi:hypothetical protein
MSYPQDPGWYTRFLDWLDSLPQTTGNIIAGLMYLTVFGVFVIIMAVVALGIR